MFDSNDTFTTQDQEQLQNLVQKYADGDVRRARRELASAKHVASTTKGKDGQAAVMRRYFQTHQLPDEADREKVRELSRKLHSHGTQYADIANKAALDAARDEGYITEDEHAEKLRAEQRRIIREGQRTSAELMKHLADLNSSATFEATASDEDKQRAMQAFNMDSEWERTKADFKQVYDASSIMRKVELRQRHPELYNAVFGR